MIEISSVIIYPRKSREDEQREKETGEDSLATMTNLLTATCNRLGIPFSQADIMPEIGSADTIDGRPIFSRIIKELLPSGKYQGVVVREISRLGRGNFADAGRIYETIINNKIYVITPNRTYDPTNSSDLRFIRMELFMAREEYEMTKERLWYGKDARGKQGYATHYLPVLGLKSYRGKFTLIPEELETLRRIFTMRADGISFIEIASTFNSEGLLSKKKRKWDPTSIREITNNKRYIGIATWDGQEIPAQHPPLVDIELWNMVQEVNKERYIPNNRVENIYLITKMWCRECGRRMYGWTDRAHTKVSGKWKYYNRKHYYLCEGRRDTPKCSHKIETHYVHDRIMEELYNLVQKDIWNKLAKEMEQALKSDNLEVMLKNKEVDLRTKENFLGKIESDYASETLSATLYSRHFEQTNNAIQVLRHEVSELKKKILQRKTAKTEPEKIRKKLEALLAEWGSLTNKRKKEIINAVFPRIEIAKNGAIYIDRRFPTKL